MKNISIKQKRIFTIIALVLLITMLVAPAALAKGAKDKPDPPGNPDPPGQLPHPQRHPNRRRNTHHDLLDVGHRPADQLLGLFHGLLQRGQFHAQRD